MVLLACVALANMVTLVNVSVRARGRGGCMGNGKISGLKKNDPLVTCPDFKRILPSG